MSRARGKIDYPFKPFPRVLPPHWAALSFFQRCLMLGAWHISDENNRVEVVTKDWERSLCRSLEIDGVERPNAQRALRIIHGVGLIEIRDQGYAQLLFRPSSAFVPETFRTPSAHIPEVDKPAKQLNSHSAEEKRVEIEEREREARARESSARFEKPPVGEAPPNTPPSEPRPVSPETRCWQLYQRALGTEHLLLPVNHREALCALVSAARGEADGASQGEAFERAVQRILAAWMAEKYWKDKRPGLRNLAERIEAGHLVRPKAKPVVKLVGAPLKASECHSDEDLLAWPAWREGDLDIYQKQRRWELQAQLDERKAGAAQ